MGAVKKRKNWRRCCLEPSLCLRAEAEIRYACIGEKCWLDVFLTLAVCAAGNCWPQCPCVNSVPWCKHGLEEIIEEPLWTKKGDPHAPKTFQGEKVPLGNQGARSACVLAWCRQNLLCWGNWLGEFALCRDLCWSQHSFSREGTLLGEGCWE